MSQVVEKRVIPSPEGNPETKAFWDAARAGRSVVPRCVRCERAHWYPRAVCPFCLSTDIRVEEASGKGTIYSFSIVRAAQPYVLAYVQLQEGPCMLTNVLSDDPDALSVGQAVSVVLVPSQDGTPVPMFKA